MSLCLSLNPLVVPDNAIMSAVSVEAAGIMLVNHLDGVSLCFKSCQNILPTRHVMMEV